MGNTVLGGRVNVRDGAKTRASENGVGEGFAGGWKRHGGRNTVEKDGEEGR